MRHLRDCYQNDEEIRTRDIKTFKRKNTFAFPWEDSLESVQLCYMMSNIDKIQGMVTALSPPASPTTTLRILSIPSHTLPASKFNNLLTIFVFESFS